MKFFQIEEKLVKDIIIKDRARMDVGDVSSLADSIAMVGQLAPVLVNSDNVLIDGLHRIRAIEHLGRDTIEVRVIDGISQDDHTLIELLANMDRKEFKWHEEIELKYKLHNFWKSAAEQEGKSWGYRETAKRLKCSLGGLSTDLAFAEALKVFPELKEQTTKSRAKELYKRLGNQAAAIQRMDSFSDEEKKRLMDLQAGVTEIPIKNTVPDVVAKSVEYTKEKADEAKKVVIETEKVAQRKIQVIYVAENYKTFLNKVPDNSVGMVELDPPYAINFNKIYGKTSKIKSKATDWTEKELYEFYFNYLPLIYQKMLDGSWLLCWTGKEHFIEITKIAQDIGFIVQQPGAWIKKGGSTNIPKKNMISNWEMYLVMRKGEAQFNVSSMLSAISVETVASANRIHQWEKPIELYDHFIKALGKPGTIFLSPFAGSGNCLISAAKANMMPIGCDKSQKYIPEFYVRLENFLGISADVDGI